MSRDRDLVLRTTSYASRVVRFFIKLPRKREEVLVLGKQLLRSGTSVASNYREVNRARSTAGIPLKTCDLSSGSRRNIFMAGAFGEGLWHFRRGSLLFGKETEELIAIFVTLIHKNK